MSTILSVQKIAVAFGTKPGIRDISFDLSSGATLTLLGPSGAGKSTLLRALAGLISVDAGSVTVNGKDVTTLPPEQRSVVYLHQTPLLFPHKSVLDNVAFPLRMRGVRTRHAQGDALTLLASVGLSEMARRPPSSLSGGQKQRVALARAIAAQPAVLLLDEPYTGLEPALRDEMRRLVTTLQKQYGFALMLVTHDLDDAAHHGQRVSVLLESAIRQTASLRELMRRPADPAVARFLGIRNELRGVVTTAGVFESRLGSIVLCDNASRPGAAIAMFPARAVQLCLKEAGPGLITSVAVRADNQLVEIECDGVRISALADHETPLSPGMRVTVEVNREYVALFATD